MERPPICSNPVPGLAYPVRHPYQEGLMGLDDLLGLLFLFFFIVLPALQGLLRRGRQLPPDFEPTEIPLPGEEGRSPAKPPQAQPTQPGAPARPPAPTTPPPRSPASTPPARPLVSQPQQPPRPKAPAGQRPKTLEEIERERLLRARLREQESTRPAPVRSAPPAAKAMDKTSDWWAFSTSPHAILNGVVWHQVLAEPRSQYWRRVRKTKR